MSAQHVRFRLLGPDDHAKLKQVVEPSELCRDDEQNAVRVDLNTRVLNPLFLSESRRVLSRVCPSCLQQAPKGTCNTCKQRVRPNEHEAPARVLHEIVSEEYAAKCGVKVPKHALTLSCIVVPPMRFRPRAVLRSGEERHDDLTLLAQQVARVAMRNKRLSQRSPDARRAAQESTQVAVAKYYGTGVPNTSTGRERQGAPRAGIKQRLTSKTGRFRNNMLGWRTNRSCRAVAAPRNDLGVDTVAIPASLARTVGVSDGDYVLVNRQPTLHQASMVALRVKTEPQSATIGVNTALCKGYNLDFDGDEINCWALGPRHGAASIEAKMLLGPENLAKSNVLQPTHETVAGLWLHTQGQTNKAVAMRSVRTAKTAAAALERVRSMQRIASAALEQMGLSVTLADLLPRKNAREAGATVFELEHALARMPYAKKRQNGFTSLVTSGAKGSAAHVYQCTVQLGQQLTSVTHGSDGMVRSCFGTGLTVREALDHAASARMGLVNTALQTKTVGYLYRKLCAHLHDVVPEYDGTMRTQPGQRVLQFQHSDEFEPQQPAGTLAAQSLSASSMQATLDSFKTTQSGAHGAISSLQRFMQMVGSSNPDQADARNVVVRFSRDNRIAPPGRVLLRDVCSRRATARGHRHSLVLDMDESRLIRHRVDVRYVAEMLRRRAPRCRVRCVGPGRVAAFADCADDLPRPRPSDVVYEPVPSKKTAKELMHQCREHEAMGAPDMHVDCVATVAQTLGIEAAREVFVRMTMETLSNTPKHHAELLADTMLWSGEPVPLTRQGLHSHAGHRAPLACAAFECPVEAISRAASQHGFDDLSTSASRMCVLKHGDALPKHGTSGMFTVTSLARHAPKRAQPIATTAYDVFDFVRSAPTKRPANCAFDTRLPETSKKRSRWANAQPSAVALAGLLVAGNRTV